MTAVTSNQQIIDQLKALGYAIQEPQQGFITFEYEIPVGRFIGKKVSMALQLDGSFPMNPPAGGLHIKPLLLPKSGGGGTHPFGAIHDSPLGPDWAYWSRPFANWNRAPKTVEGYFGHIKNLFATIPNEQI